MIEVIVVYTAGIAPSMVATGDGRVHADGEQCRGPEYQHPAKCDCGHSRESGTPSLVSVTAANAGPIPANWTADLSLISSHLLRFTQNAATDGAGPGGTISISTHPRQRPIL